VWSRVRATTPLRALALQTVPINIDDCGATTAVLAVPPAAVLATERNIRVMPAGRCKTRAGARDGVARDVRA
jgi:hypothetical protein